MSRSAAQTCVSIGRVFQFYLHVCVPSASVECNETSGVIKGSISASVDAGLHSKKECF
jgi:hypothetical protein